MRGVGCLTVLAALLASGCATLREADADRALVAGLAAQARGDLIGAERAYRAALTTQPSSAAANNLGVVHVLRKDLKTAARWFSFAGGLDDGDLVPRVNLGVVLYHLGQTGEAADALFAARRARLEAMEHIAPIGRINWDLDRYAFATATADAVASRYLDRVMSTTAPPDPGAPEVLVARAARIGN